MSYLERPPPRPGVLRWEHGPKDERAGADPPRGAADPFAGDPSARCDHCGDSVFWHRAENSDPDAPTPCAGEGLAGCEKDCPDFKVPPSATAGG